MTNPNTPHQSIPIPPKFKEPKTPAVTNFELNRIIKNIKQNKAPGYDYIDYNLIKRIHTATPKLLLTLINKCLEFSYFPDSFKKGNVVLFHKEGKDPKNPKNYRPICLLPAFGKILERVIHGRINHHLHGAKYWSPLQYGFKQGISTENALEALMDKIRDDKAQEFKTLLVSIDIQGAFDSISWPKVINILKNSPCPTYLINIIISFLENRFVTLEENGIKVTKKTFGGCPQGSCLGPLLWLLIAEVILKDNWGDNVRIQAFADDFMLIIRALTKQQLIEIANEAIKKFGEWATQYGLKINWGKTEILYLNRDKTRNLPTEKSSEITGIKYQNIQLKSSEKLKYLGLVIDKNLNWNEHCLSQINKIQKSFRLLYSMTTKRWGLPSPLVKTWYRTVVERTLVYAAPIWGQKISKCSTQKLLSCQRHFALAIVKAYRTAPTAALLVLSGLVPIHLQVKYEAVYGSVTRLQKSTEQFGTYFMHTDYTGKLNVWETHPAETTEPRTGQNDTDIQIYTDGSKLETGATGSAFVAFQNNNIIHTWSAPLRTCNSVFQAELLAVLRASSWGHSTGKHFSIRSDCSSVISSLSKPFNRNQMINEIKEISIRTNNKFKISWVKAHVGIEGNEAADKLAKNAAENKENKPKIIIPKPISHLKKELKELIINQWQSEWDYGETGRETYKYYPKVTTKRIHSCRLLAQIYTGHGALPEYLHRFKIKNSPNCTHCNELGTPLHFLTSCPLTQQYHLVPITPINEKLWYSQLADNTHVQNKAKKVVRWLIDNEDIITY